MTITPWVSADDLENSTSDLAPQAAKLASRILFTLTGRIYGGEKTVTETYLASANSCDALKAETLVAYGIGTLCRVSPYRIGLRGEQRIPLRRRPVRAIISVRNAVSGEPYSPASFDVTHSSYLVGSACAGLVSGLVVEYRYGTPPPEDGVEAARALADELVKLFGDDPNSECRLKNVSSFSRNGVNFEIEDARTILTDGRTGLPEVDLFVASVNPTKARLRSRVLSPDAHIAR